MISVWSASDGLSRLQRQVEFQEPERNPSSLLGEAWRWVNLIESCEPRNENKIFVSDRATVHALAGDGAPPRVALPGRSQRLLREHGSHL